MDLYKDPWLSMVKFVQDLSDEAAQTLGIAAPSFVNFDAHALIEELPAGDLLGLIGWSRFMDGKMVTFHCGIGVSTDDDPDMLRHIDIMTLVARHTEVEKRVPLYDSSAPDPTAQVGAMIVGNTPTIDPTVKGNIRTLQICTIRLETTLTAGYLR